MLRWQIHNAYDSFGYFQKHPHRKPLFNRKYREPTCRRGFVTHVGANQLADTDFPARGAKMNYVLALT